MIVVSLRNANQRRSIKTSSVKGWRKFDEAFKREAVRNWLDSGKSAEVVGSELGITANLLYA
jgi:transposase-like protein